MLLSKWNISWWQSTNIGGQHEDGSGWCWPNLEMSVSSEKQGNLAHFVQRTTCLVNIVSFSVIFFFQFMLVSLFQQDLFTMCEESTQSVVRISRTMACHY